MWSNKIFLNSESNFMPGFWKEILLHCLLEIYLYVKEDLEDYSIN